MILPHGPLLLGVMGDPVSHSLSPRLHTAALTRLGIEGRYVPLPVTADRMPAALSGLKALGFAGANVTMPHKQAVAWAVDERTVEAEGTFSVNVVQVVGDRLIGHNTDAPALQQAIRERGPLPRRAVVLGAGGAARAAVWALQQMDMQVTVFNRTPGVAETLNWLGTDIFPRLLCAEELAPVLAETDLLINATPVGMHAPNISPLPAGLSIPPRATVVDYVYTPLDTQLLRQGRAAGCAVVDGLELLIGQAILSLEIWLGMSLDRADVARVMRAAVQEPL